MGNKGKVSTYLLLFIQNGPNMNTEFWNSGKVLRILHSHSPLKKRKKSEKSLQTTTWSGIN